MTRVQRIGRSIGVATIVAMILAASCGRGDSNDQARAAEPTGAAVLKTSTAAQGGVEAQQPERTATQQAVQGAQEQAPEPLADGPRLQLEKGAHDFGKIYDTNPQVYDLKVTNVGTKPLTIQRVSTSCGCTSTNKGEIEGRPIKPGEEIFIEIKYSPKSTASKVTKTVTIQSDDYLEPVQRFKVSAQLIEPARLDPLRYQMGQIRAGEGHKTSFYVISPDPRIEVLSVESESQHLEFEVIDDPNLNNPSFPGRKRIDVTISPDIPSGTIKLSFTVKTKAAAETGAEPVESALSGMILGHVRGELTNNPRFLRIRNVAAGEKFETRTMLYSENARPFKVTGTRVADSTVGDVQVEVIPLEPFENDEPGYWIVVTGVLPEGAKGAFQGKVLVDTDVPNETEKAIIFNGIVRREIPGQN